VPVLELELAEILMPPPLVFLSDVGPANMPELPAALALPTKVMASAAELVDAILT
jgi:hypothetical protein